MAGYLLIFGVGPLPTLGLIGAGVATSTAKALGGCLALGALFTDRTPLQVEPRSLFVLDGTLAWRIVRLALPNLTREGISRTGHTLFKLIVTALGTAAPAAHQITVRVESLSYISGRGFSLAAATLVGQSLGKGEEDTAVAAVHRTGALACRVIGAIGLGFAFFSHQLVVAFGPNQETLRLAGAALQFAALEQVPIALNMVLSAAFQGGRGHAETYVRHALRCADLSSCCGVSLRHRSGLGIGRRVAGNSRRLGRTGAVDRGPFPAREMATGLRMNSVVFSPRLSRCTAPAVETARHEGGRPNEAHHRHEGHAAVREGFYHSGHANHRGLMDVMGVGQHLRGAEVGYDKEWEGS